MKLKGINIFERHVEKLVLAIFFVVLLAMVALQFLSSPNAVEVSGRKVPPEQARNEVKVKAEQKIAQLAQTTIPDSIPERIPSVRERFDEALRADPAPRTIVAFGEPRVVLEGAATAGAVDIPVIDESSVFAAIEPPAPTKPIAALVEGAIDPLVVEMYRDRLSSYVPLEQPYDVHAVSVQFAFDAEAYRDALTRPAAGATPVPQQWWLDRGELVHVDLVRQRRLPDGSWSDENPIEQIPGRPSFRSTMSRTDFKASELRDLLAAERNDRAALRRPRFYPFVAGEPWRPPVQLAELNAHLADALPQQREIQRLLRQLVSIRAQIEQVERTMTTSDAGGSRRDADRPDPRRYIAGRGGGGGRGSGAGSDDARRRSAEQAQREAEARRREAAKARLENLHEQEREILARLSGLGVSPEGHRTASPDVLHIDEPLVSVGDATLQNITLWRHDITAEPGETYRYRARLHLINPYYANGAQLPAEQKELADPLTIISDFSPWSEPVTVPHPTQYFVTSASLEGRGIGGDATATVEIYRFFYGYWRKADLRLTPGGAVVARIEAPALDIFEIVEGEAGPVLGDRVPLGRSSIVADTGAFLLNTAPSLTTGDGRTQAFLGERDGRVTVRSEAEDEASLERIRLDLSASVGTGASVSDPAGDVESAGRPAGRGNPGGSPPPAPPGSTSPARDVPGGRDAPSND